MGVDVLAHDIIDVSCQGELTFSGFRIVQASFRIERR